MNTFAVIFAGITFFSTMFGGLCAARFSERLGILASFAAGVLVAVPLFDLLPESIKLAREAGVPMEHLFYATAAGFLFLLILERYISVHRVCEPDGICRNVHHPSGGMIGAVELSAHSFMDGLAIGVGFKLDFQVGMILGVAVIAHDFSDGINTVTVMLKYGNSLRASLGMLLVDAVTPALGAGSTLLFSLPERQLVLFLPFFAGGFLYLGAADLLPEAHERNAPPVTILFTLLGFVVIFVLTRFLAI